MTAHSLIFTTQVAHSIVHTAIWLLSIFILLSSRRLDTTKLFMERSLWCWHIEYLFKTILNGLNVHRKYSKFHQKTKPYTSKVHQCSTIFWMLLHRKDWIKTLRIELKFYLFIITGVAKVIAIAASKWSIPKKRAAQITWKLNSLWHITHHNHVACK